MGLSIFWDNSNIWLVGQEVCKQNEPGHELAFRIHFAHLLDYVRNGRDIDYAYVAGSIPPNNDPLWDRFRNLGVNVETQERGARTGREVAVDEIIQLKMANLILDQADPGTMVLLTGDGSGYDDGIGFTAQLERAIRHRWEIEVVSWDARCSNTLRTFARNNGTYRRLEPVYGQVTFINNLRWAADI